MLSVHRTCLSFLALVVTGCSYTASFDDAPLPAPLIEPLPLNVGVYFSPEFRSYEHVEEVIVYPLPPDTIHFALGPPSVAMFERILKAAFVTVVNVETLFGPHESSAPLAGVIAPEITEFSHAYAVGVASIDYAVTFYDSSGEKSDVWTLVGTGSINVGFSMDFLIVQRNSGRTASRAMRDAAATFLREVQDRPAVKAWLAEKDIVPDNRPPEGTGVQ